MSDPRDAEAIAEAMAAQVESIIGSHLYGRALVAVSLLTDDERARLFERFCRSCGKYDPDHKCRCWDDS